MGGREKMEAKLVVWIVVAVIEIAAIGAVAIFDPLIAFMIDSLCPRKEI